MTGRDTDFVYGEEVEIPWGHGTSARGVIYDTYRSYSDRLMVVALLTPEISEYLVSEPTTVACPAEKAKRGRGFPLGKSPPDLLKRECCENGSRRSAHM